jgi:hypothetical protein
MPCQDHVAKENDEERQLHVVENTLVNNQEIYSLIQVNELILQ